MSPLPPKLEKVAEALLAASTESMTVSLDAMGEAIGVVPVSADDIDALMATLEDAGRTVVGPEGPRGVARLRLVIPAAHALAATLGRKPTLAEIAAKTGMDADEVRHALALARVMGR
jgi:predicted DsbA family dithiol-disulfide isomerase